MSEIRSPSGFIAFADSPLSVVSLTTQSAGLPAYVTLFTPAVPFEVGWASLVPGVGTWHNGKANVLCGDGSAHGEHARDLITNTITAKA